MAVETIPGIPPVAIGHNSGAGVARLGGDLQNFAIRVVTGDIDGDERADLLVRAVGGLQVFRGAVDLAASFAAPVHVQSGSFEFAATLADFDGEGIDELVSFGGWRRRGRSRARIGARALRARPVPRAPPRPRFRVVTLTRSPY